MTEALFLYYFSLMFLPCTVFLFPLLDSKRNN